MLRRCLCCLLLAGLRVSVAAQRAEKDLKSATEWFQRADDQMNLRTAGSPPFHMKVVFHALPGLVLDEKESSQTISGDGTYDEIWISPKRWRRH